MATEYGYIRKNKRGSEGIDTYHTDVDCQNLPDDATKKEIEHIERMGLEMCSFCAGEVDTSWSGVQLAAKIRNGDY